MGPAGFRSVVSSSCLRRQASIAQAVMSRALVASCIRRNDEGRDGNDELRGRIKSSASCNERFTESTLLGENAA
jgi:hypothetical protein